MDEEQIFLRPAQAEDLSIIKTMVMGARLNPFHLDWGRFVVAVDLEENVIGCAQIRIHRGRIFELASIVVLPQWQNHGVASALIERLLQGEKRPVWLMCSAHLTPFYEKFDFYEVTALDYMPSYFRRIRFWIDKLFQIIGVDNRLAVMVIS